MLKLSHVKSCDKNGFFFLSKTVKKCFLFMQFIGATCPNINMYIKYILRILVLLYLPKKPGMRIKIKW